MQAVSGSIPIPVTAETLEVPERELARLLGSPPDEPLREGTAELAQQARRWFGAHARPWAVARVLEIESIEGDRVRLAGGTIFSSPALRSRLARGQAHALAMTASSAGPETEAESARLWAEDRPDLAYVLDALASGAVERLATMAGAALCQWAEPQGMAVLPHYSPGYAGWDLGDQIAVLKTLVGSGEAALPGPLRALESGMLLPRKSMLAVFGLTRARELALPQMDACPCVHCSFSPCAYRRAPYRSGPKLDVEHPEGAASPGKRITTIRPAAAQSTGKATATPSAAAYAFPEKALDRWARELLHVEKDKRGYRARFRFHGHICRSGDSGERLDFEFDVRIGPKAAGTPVLSAVCRPAKDARGYEDMCEYMRDPEGWMAENAAQRPFEGRPLDEVLTWDPPTNPAGCLCDESNRNHKWRIALQTIHYALARDHEDDTA